MAPSLDNTGILTWTPTGLARQKSGGQVREGAPTYGASVGLSRADAQHLVTTLRRGLPVSAFDRLRDQMAISAKQLAQATSIAVRTLARRRQAGRLRKDESERLLRIAALFDRAVEVLEDRDRARHWFRTPKRALGGASPLDYADTEPGAREVEDLLGRIEHGVFS